MSSINKCNTKLKRQEMYKARTPPWKETYRSRCLERLRENRAQLHQARRHLVDCNDYNTNNIDRPSVSDVDLASGGLSDGWDEVLNVDDIMKEEWERMKHEKILQAEEAENHGHSFETICELYEDICDEIKREIQEDLKREEMQLLSLQTLCDEVVEEEEALCSGLESLMTEEVICPLCEKSSLIENKGVIVCRCGLRIDTEQDCISLKNVRDNLQAGADEHSKDCETKPSFSLTQKFGISNLLMHCPECEFLYVIV